MGFMEAIEHVFKNYAVFQGRARRSEYWYFALFHSGITLAFSLLSFTGLGVLLLGIYSLATLIPGLAAAVRRMHDVGRSGVWLLMALAPLFGWIFLVVWMSQDSQPGSNRYGPNPKGSGAGAGFYSGRNGGGQSGLAVQCLSGPMQGQTYRIGSEGILFGRTASCGVRFPEGTPGISSQHCRIRFDQGVPVLIDLNSTYGTTMAGGKMLPPHYPERIGAGTRFYLGTPENLFQIILL